MKFVVELNIAAFDTPAKAAVALADLAKHLPNIPHWEAPDGKLLFGELGSAGHNIASVRMYATRQAFNGNSLCNPDEPIHSIIKANVEEGIAALDASDEIKH